MATHAPPPSGPATRRLGMTMRRALARQREHLSSGPLILAVSGGADSLAMLLASRETGLALRQRIIAAHFSHGLRPTADVRERASVRRTAEALGVRFIAGGEQSRATEAGAREARYRFLAAAAAEHAACCGAHRSHAGRSGRDDPPAPHARGRTARRGRDPRAVRQERGGLSAHAPASAPERQPSGHGGRLRGGGGASRARRVESLAAVRAEPGAPACAPRVSRGEPGRARRVRRIRPHRR